MLYHGIPVNQSEFCMYISYFDYSRFSIIHNIPTLCNILIQYKSCDYLLVFGIQNIYIYYCFFSQINTSYSNFLTAFLISSSLRLHQHLILNVEIVFNNDSNIFLSLSILSAANYMISRKCNQLRLHIQKNIHMTYKQDFYKNKYKEIYDLFLEYLVPFMDDLEHLALIE